MARYSRLSTMGTVAVTFVLLWSSLPGIKSQYSGDANASFASGDGLTIASCQYDRVEPGHENTSIIIKCTATSPGKDSGTICCYQNDIPSPFLEYPTHKGTLITSYYWEFLDGGQMQCCSINGRCSLITNDLLQNCNHYINGSRTSTPATPSTSSKAQPSTTPSPRSTVGSDQTPSCESQSCTKGAIIMISVGSIMFIVSLIISLAVCVWKRKNDEKHPKQQDMMMNTNNVVNNHDKVVEQPSSLPETHEHETLLGK